MNLGSGLTTYKAVGLRFRTSQIVQLYKLGIVQAKMKICWKFTHPQAIQDVDEFVSSWQWIRRNLALHHHLLTKGSSAVNGCRQNESPNSDKDITIIHMIPAKTCVD